MREEIHIVASGDSFITRRFPQGGYRGIEKLQDIIQRNDAAFSNLEMTFHRMEGTPAAVSGGTWAMADPECLDSMMSYGFNLFSTANNHSGDYGEGGILATIRHLRERGMVFSGTGSNLAEASKPCYLETQKGRIGLISVSADFAVSSAAGGQSERVPGRPGMNPLRWKRTYHVTQEHFDMVKELAGVTYVNAYTEYGARMGYDPPVAEGTRVFGKYSFVLSDRDEVHSVPDEGDMQRLEREIREACRQSDLVMVSMHVHETDQDDYAVPPEFMRIAAKRCIDAGANAVIGHGPHEMRGAEIYNGGLILYSLGNYIFQTDTVSVQPYDAMVNKNLPVDTRVGEYMEARSKHGTAGFGTLRKIWESVLAEWDVCDGKIREVRFYPLALGFGKGVTERGIPQLSEDDSILQYFASLCRPFGTELVIRDHAAILKIGEEA